MRAQRRAAGRVPAEVRAPLLTLAALLAGSGLARRPGRRRTPSPTATTPSRAPTSPPRARRTTAATTGSRTSSASTGRSRRGTFRNAVAEHGPPGSVCVNIWTTRTPGEASPNFDVCVTRQPQARPPDRERQPARPARRRHAEWATRRRSSTSRRRLVVRFDPDLIRRPAAYRWSVQATTFERGCTQPRLPGRGAASRPHACGRNWARRRADELAFRRIPLDSVDASVRVGIWPAFKRRRAAVRSA